MKKPQLAVDADEAKLGAHIRRGGVVLLLPKVDGVRGGQFIHGSFTGRSLKAFKNIATGEYWSDVAYTGIDGELVMPASAGWTWTSPGLCRNTTGLTNRIHDPMVPDLIAFDLIDRDTADLPYHKRYARLARYVRNVRDHKLHVMPMVEVRRMDDVYAYQEKWLGEGYEGLIIRNPMALPKEGRSTQEMEFWRIKEFVDFEFVIDEVIEAKENRNEAKVNALGHTERSSHKANKHGKGMIGMLRGRLLKDVVWRGKVVLKKGHVVDASAGELSHAEREEGWRRPLLYVKKIGKGKLFPYGVKDKARMPIFLGIRSKEDLS
jgi:DNA ligase-1